MLIVITIIAQLLALALIAGTFLFLKRRTERAASASTADILASIERMGEEATELARYVDSYAPRATLDAIADQMRSLEAEIARETEALKTIEQKLDTAQKTVESRESAQQDIKSSKEEDEAKLEVLLSSYTSISEESMALEKQLAASLKNLDTIRMELDLSSEQRELLDELSEALSEAGERLRDLLTEYQVINERLQALQQQHHDLEDEYTKLVEQQLGE